MEENRFHGRLSRYFVVVVVVSVDFSIAGLVVSIVVVEDVVVLSVVVLLATGGRRRGPRSSIPSRWSAPEPSKWWWLCRSHAASEAPEGQGGNEGDEFHVFSIWKCGEATW
jgi:hypothetical protein